MTSFNAYERNLTTRLNELRDGDRAYTIHGDAILETLVYEPLDTPYSDNQRIVDIGCGLGFISLKMAQTSGTYVLGTDPSEKAIEIATKEHANQSNLDFLTVSAQELPDRMKALHIEAFDRAIINMVLHSVDDETCRDILNSTRLSLANPSILTVIVPGSEWLTQKLIEKAKASGMGRESGVQWVYEQLQQDSVDIAVGINGHPSYDEPITVYNRSLSDYGVLLKSTGYEVDIKVSAPENPVSQQILKTAFWEWSDHLNGYELSTRDRHILMTQPKN